MVRLKDIAKKANVSIATVSYVLNGTGNVSKETREKVLKVVEELNYTPDQIAKSLKLNKTSTVAVIAEDVTVFNAPEIIDGINECADGYGFSIILANLRIHRRIGNRFSEIDKCKPVIKKVLDNLISKKVDGIIYIGVHPRDVTGILETSKPVVYTYCYTTNPDDYSVHYDDESAAYEATDYLIRLGHKKIGLISGPIDSVPSHGRFNGYYKALVHHGLPFYPSYVKTGDWEYASGYQMAKELLGEPDPPTAILAMNDLMAGGVLDACKEMSVRVPDDLSVIGFDNRECSFYYTPKLTTMDLPLREMGIKAMDTIYRVINRTGDDLPRTVKLKCRLVERHSTAACKNL